MTDRPTHRHKASGAAVFPDGYRVNQVEPLPTEYWQQQDRTAAIAAIKAEAARRIEAVAPQWRQIEDIYNPTAAGATERRAAVVAIQQWSNAEEAKLGAA